MVYALRYFAPPMGNEATPRSLTSRNAYVFRCPRCRRTPQIERSRWWSILDAVVRADFDEIDISMLG